MPLRLNVGVSKKVGLPAYSSIGASCHLEVELDNSLLRDLDGFHDQVRDAFIAAQQAVNDELVRLQAQAEVGQTRPALTASNGHQNGNGHSVPKAEVPRSRPRNPATPSQVRAIIAIARNQHADLDGLLCDHGVTRAEELSIAQASKLIDQLKAAGQI